MFAIGNLAMLPMIESIRECLVLLTPPTNSAEYVPGSSARDQGEQHRRLNRLLSKIEQSNHNDNVTACRLCATNDVDTMCTPCGHLCLCGSCAECQPLYCPECLISIDSVLQVRQTELTRWRIDVCFFCESNTADFIALDCGHIFACKACIREVAPTLCPICNAIIKQTMSVLQSSNGKTVATNLRGCDESTEAAFSSSSTKSEGPHDCCKRPTRAVIMPCGHVIKCMRCFASVKNCSKCNVIITKLVRLYGGMDGGQYLNGSYDCVICTEAQSRMLAFLPCGHSDVCVMCWQQIRTITGSTCPICRTKITKAIEL